MRTFKDLNFKNHSISESAIDSFKGAKQAVEEFENGYGVSVLFGSCFYSNGINSFELAVLNGGEIDYNTGITEDVFGYLSEDEVTEVMRKVQLLK